MDNSSRNWLDDLDSLQGPPRRVVSLVPSMTESIFDLGWGDSVVGVTDFCRFPEKELASLPHLGGPKTPDVQKIISLSPDLVIANQEENDREAIRELQSAGLWVWITFPRTVDEALAALYSLARGYRSPTATQRIKTLETAVEWTRAAVLDRRGFSYFCPIWQGEAEDGGRWWMTFNGQTYANSLLELFGGQNIFAMRQRRYPLAADLAAGLDIPVEAAGDRDTRYPRISLAELQASNPDVILLPDEPFPFTSEHKSQIEAALAGSPAVASGRILFVDGSLVTWHGTRLARAIQSLPGLFAEM